MACTRRTPIGELAGICTSAAALLGRRASSHRGGSAPLAERRLVPKAVLIAYAQGSTVLKEPAAGRAWPPYISGSWRF